MCVCVICSADQEIEELTSQIFVTAETGAKFELKTFVFKNTTDKKKFSIVFAERSVVKYQLCKSSQARRFD